MEHRNDLDPNPRAVVGDNKPPAHIDDEYIELAARGKKLADASKRVPKADVEGAELKLATYMKQCKEFQKLANKWRQRVKQPFLDGSGEVQTLGKELENIVLSGMGVASKELGIIAKEKAEAEAERQKEARRIELLAQEKAERLRKEAEAENNAVLNAQAKEAEKALKVATKATKEQSTNIKTEDGAQIVFKKVWDFDIEDMNKVPVAILRKYLGDAAFEKAIRAAVKAGERNIKGVKIFQKDQQSTR